MKEKWLYYMKEMAINTICFFVIWLLLDYLFETEINLRETIVRSVLFALITVPLTEYFKRRENKNNNN